jgi:hypothetical protein
VTGSSVKGIPEGLHTITPHIVVRDAAQAAERRSPAPPRRRSAAGEWGTHNKVEAA